MEELQTKGYNVNMETKPRNLAVQKNIGTVHRRAGEQYINECLRATGKRGGGSLQVWGFISANGVRDLVGINSLNVEKYRQILA